jgi:hypothetical protein
MPETYALFTFARSRSGYENYVRDSSRELSSGNVNASGPEKVCCEPVTTSKANAFVTRTRVAHTKRPVSKVNNVKLTVREILPPRLQSVFLRSANATYHKTAVRQDEPVQFQEQPSLQL